MKQIIAFLLIFIPLVIMGITAPVSFFAVAILIALLLLAIAYITLVMWILTS